MMIRSVKLPFAFDPASLRSDLEEIRPGEWIAHFNKEYHDGGWLGLPLRSLPGSSRKLIVRPQAHAGFVDTDILERCPATRAALSVFQSTIGSVRFLKLVPGATIKEHRDYELTFASGQVRLHVPIMTNPQV